MVASSTLRPPGNTTTGNAPDAARAAHQRVTMERTLTHLVLIAAAAACAAPFFYVIAASLKDQGALFHYPPVWVQIPPSLENYQRLLFESGFPRWMLNTLIVATTVPRRSSSSTRWPAMRWPSWSSPASALSSC